MSFQRQIAEHPWADWYHCMGNTYGTWLPGDPCGFRTRWEREHIDGDYRNPPPKGKYDQRFQRSRELMKRDPVLLTWEQRNRALDELMKSFQKWKIEVQILSVDRVHIHLLARFRDHNPRHFVESLDVFAGRMTEAGVASISQIASLESLNLLFCPIKNKGVHSLPKLKNLRSLDLSRSAITDDSVADLLMLHRLRKIILCRVSLSAAAVRALHAGNPDLEIVGQPGP